MTRATVARAAGAAAGAALAALAFAWLLFAPPAEGATGETGPVVADAAADQQAATTLSLRVRPEEIPYGSEAMLTATLARARASTGVSGQPVRLEARRPGAASWSRVGTASTGAGGVASFRKAPKRTTEYRARFTGTDALAGARSSERVLSVRTSLSAALSATTIRLGQKVTITGAVIPGHAGQEVRLQRSTSSGWTTGRDGGPVAGEHVHVHRAAGLGRRTDLPRREARGRGPRPGRLG